MAAVRARDVVVRSQRLADADGDRFLADVQVREAGHQRARVEIVDPFLEQADGHHLAVHAQGRSGLDAARDGVGRSGDRGLICPCRSFREARRILLDPPSRWIITMTACRP